MLDVPQNHISVPIEPKSGEIDPLKNNEEKIGRSSPGLDEKKSSMAQKSTMWKKKEEDKVEKKNDESPDDYKIPTYKIMWYKFKFKTQALLEYRPFMLVMGLITLYALFADDIRVLSTDKYGDDHFYGSYCFLLAIFGLEMILSCMVIDNYFLGFFFWLDLLSLFSLLFDNAWIAVDLVGGSGAQATKNATKLARASRASRVGTRAGRIIRIVRMIRLVKLYKHAQQGLSKQPHISHHEDIIKEIRSKERKKSNANPQNVNNSSTEKKMGSNPMMMSKIKPNDGSKELEMSKSKNFEDKGSGDIKPNETSKEIKDQKEKNENDNYKKQNTLEKKKMTETSHEFGPSQNRMTSHYNSNSKTLKSGVAGGSNQSKEIPQETNVGRKLSELTTKRVVMLVMAIMFSIPIFSLETYVEEYSSYESGLRTIYMWYLIDPNSNAYKISLNTYINENTNSEIRNPLVYLSCNDLDLYQGPTLFETMRDEDKMFYVYDHDGLSACFSIVDIKADNQLDAILGMCRTVFVCFVLTGGALFFSKDANDLVLQPIESMLEKVKRIAKNPLEAAQIEENEAVAMEEILKKNKKEKKKDETYETSILEKTIIKIGALLALGFGEAGSEIIVQNMAKSGEVDPMIPGKKIMAIFGFCDIRNFTDATEILQEDVMVFVNEIAEIVHSLVDHFSGAANKNIGDAFLLVWKYPDSEIKHDPNNTSILMLSESRQVKQIADMAVISFLKIVAGINLSKKLKKYKDHKGLNERMPNYCVRMGFGLHVGWAIEGAIGSEFKIDASYLSPNVNMSSRLEAATKQFGVPLLISGALFKTLTPETQREMRHIDRVTVKGSIEPMDLYTCDVDIQNLVAKVKVASIDKYNSQKLSKTEKKKLKLYNRLKRKELKKKVLENKTTVANLFTSDKELRSMRETFPPEFYEIFSQGLDKYFKGEWDEAKEILEKTHTMLPFAKDGPSNTLLEVIKEFGGKPPSNWAGYRELTEK